MVADWQNEPFRRFIEQLAHTRTLIRYDRPGTGLSDPGTPPINKMDEELAALDAVIKAAGGRVSIFGASSGGCVAMVYAAVCPERVDRLVLYSGYANGADVVGPKAQAAILDIVSNHWGAGSRLLADVFMPESSKRERDEFVRFQRASATPKDAAALLRSVYAYDVRDQLPLIKAPTLVMHRRDDRAIRFELGQDMAARIPDASFVALDGANHPPWLGDANAVVHAVLRFLGDPTPSSLDRHGSLSAREVDVLRLVAQGKSDQEIATELVLSAHTVHRHVANIRAKLGVSSRGAAAAHAVRAGLI